MKQTAGNRDANGGGSEGGVTAASALAVMQEAGNALSRDENGTAYRAFREIVKFVIELIRQFYDLPRFFRIEGERGAYQYITFTNAQIKEQSSIGIDGTQYFRKPEFDLDVEASKESEYSQQSQNNLALQFYQAGFFNPMNAPMTLPCLDMMEFKGKDKVVQSILKGYADYQVMMAQQAAMGMAGGGGGEVNGTQTKAAEAEERADKKQAEAKAQSVGGVTPR